MVIFFFSQREAVAAASIAHRKSLHPAQPGGQLAALGGPLRSKSPCEFVFCNMPISFGL